MTVARRKLIIILASVAVAAIAISAAIDLAIATALHHSISRLTGTRVESDRVHFDPFNGRLSIRHLKLLQPKGFPKGTLARIPEVTAEFDTRSFFGNKPHVRHLFVNVAEVVVIRNKEGQLNVDALRLVREAEKAGKPIELDRLELTIESVIEKDFTGEKPVVERTDLNMYRQTYENIPGTAQVAGVVLGQALRSAAVKGAVIFGTAAVAGVAFLPVGAAVLFATKDSFESDVRAGSRESFRTAIQIARRLGEITEENSRQGVLRANINGSDVRLEIQKLSLRKCHVKVSARKMLLPQPKTAGGFLYELMQITG